MDPQENDRLADLRSLGQLPHMGPSAALDAIVEIAAEVCGTPIALVTLVEEHDQYFKAQRGFDRTGTPREVSFCTHAIEGADVYEVCDASAAELFADNPLVTGPDQVRFYAGAPMTMSSGHRIGTVCVLDDEPRKLSEHQRLVLTSLAKACVAIFEESAAHRLQERWVRRTLDALDDAVVSVDERGCVTYLNNAAAPLLSSVIAPDSGTHLAEALRVFDVDGSHVSPLADCLESGERQTRADGRLTSDTSDERHEIEYSVAPIVDDDATLSGAVMVLRDVSRERDLERRAYLDELTGACSRYAFERHLAAHLATDGVPGGAVLFFDLDRFKAVNDSLGHGVGDDLLRSISLRVSSLVPHGNVFARIGGDEFAIFVPRSGPQAVERLGKNLLSEIGRLCATFPDVRANISASIGVAMLDEPNLSVGEVLRRADAGCYRSKRSGGGGLSVFNPADQIADSSAGNAGWQTIVQEALAHDDLILFGQRIRSLDPTERDSAEVLLRLVHDGRLVSASEFLPPLERTGLAVKVDEWVVRTTLERLASRQSALAEFEVVHLNLSARTIADRTVADGIVSLIADSAVPGSKLCFEITETAAITDMAAVHRFMTTVQSLGCRFALDDFGRGFASFEHLKMLPVDVIKIDRLFVADLATDPVSRHMVAAVQGVCEHLGIQTVAEGVERIETVEELIRLGVNSAQGFLYHRPERLDALLARDPRAALAPLAQILGKAQPSFPRSAEFQASPDSLEQRPN